MTTRDAYMADLVLSGVLRLGLYGGILAILAIVLSGCSNSGPQDLLSGRPAVPRSLTEGDAAETRNRQPHGGCDEKSGTTPTWPMERLPQAIS